MEQIAGVGLRIREVAETSSVQVRAFAVDTTKAESASTSPQAKAAAAAAPGAPAGRSHHVIHLAGPMHPDWRRALEGLGMVLHESGAEQSLLATVPDAKLDAVAALDFVDAIAT